MATPSFRFWFLILLGTATLGLGCSSEPHTLNNKIVRERMKAAQADAPPPAVQNRPAN